MIQKTIAFILPYIPKQLVWKFSKKYIAGITIEDAIKTSLKLNDEKCLVTTDLLGEFITTTHQAEENKNTYLSIIERFTQENIKGNFSIKPTSFGLLLDEECCYGHICEIVEKAAVTGNFIRLDMEDSKCVDREIDLYRRLKSEFPTNVGLVLQAFLKRTYNDIEQLMDIHTAQSPLNIRLCKGIYVEPDKIAYTKHIEIRQHYISNLELMFQYGIYAGIATHDKYIIEEAFNLIEKLDIPKDKYEFQMLLGVKPELRHVILSKGHQLRVYVPFGQEWFGYCTRRLKENPGMIKHILKSIFIK
jgi:proline dehydrogenase